MQHYVNKNNINYTYLKRAQLDYSIFKLFDTFLGRKIAKYCQGLK